MERTCQKDCGLEPGRQVVVGVSGGADSLALADCLAVLGYPVLVAHFNHCLRKESSHDQAFVQAYARSRGLVFKSASGDVAAFAGEHGLSIEEAARQMRYAFLFQIAREQAAQALAVGHTADDQVETVLMHLLRGAGLDGLKGMTQRGFLECFDPDIPLVRPLLGVWRAETETWCRSHGLDYRVDATNADTAYARNRLRHEIIPMLEDYNPQARAHIHRLAHHLAGDQRLLVGLSEEAYRTCLQSQGEGYLVFDRKRLVTLDPALGARVLRLAAFKLVKDLRDFDADAVDRALIAVLQAPDGWQTDLPGGLRLQVTTGQICLMTWEADLPEQDWPQIEEGISLEIRQPEKVALENGWWLLVDAVNLEVSCTMPFDHVDRNQAWIDADSLPGGLVIRRAMPGQRFTPLGMTAGSQKLSDFWVNVHLPQRARAGWPVVFSGKDVVWLPGFRLAHAFRITAMTKTIFHLRLIQHPE